MQVSFTGFRRNCGDHVFEDVDVRVDVEDTGVVILSLAEKVTLNGDYWVKVRLTRQELAVLARTVWANEPFGNVINQLASR